MKWQHTCEYVKIYNIKYSLYYVKIESSNCNHLQKHIWVFFNRSIYNSLSSLHDEIKNTRQNQQTWQTTAK